MKNLEVVEHFLDRKPAQSGHLTSTGKKLISYWTKVAEWSQGKIMVTSTYYSKTTSRHINLMKRKAEEYGITVEETLT